MPNPADPKAIDISPETVEKRANALRHLGSTPDARFDARLMEALSAALSEARGKAAEAERERDEANLAFQASMQRTAYLEKTRLNFVEALEACKRGLETWSSKPHNAKWWRRIDGTPIPNDLLVNIAEIIAQTANADRAERDAALSELAKLRAEAEWRPIESADWFQHIRGGIYTVVGAAKLQTAAPIGDMTELTVYRSIKDGSLWARPTVEFMDGRFAKVPNGRPSPPKDPPMTDAPTDRKLSEKALTAQDALVLSVPEAGFGNERANVTIENLARVGWMLVPQRSSPGSSGYSPDEFSPAESHPSAGAFKLGDPVQKKSGSSWRGKVVGFYATDMTPRGYCVESANEPGSVQIYPEAALVAGAFDADHPSAIREAVEGEREACAKIADKRADPTNNDCERLSFDGSTGALECSLSHRGDCLCQEHQEEAEAIAAAIRARGEEK